MICKIFYGEKLDYFVKNEHLIPYRLHPNARYRTNCYYWSSWEDKWFKVEEVKYDFDALPIPSLDHAQIQYHDGNFAWICTDLSIYDFRLERDKYNIRNKNIINSKESFAGGEIEYWFFKHNISLFDEKYQEFWKFLNPASDSRIISSRYYFIVAEERDNIYKNVKFILDNSKEKFRKDDKINLTRNEGNKKHEKHKRKKRASCSNRQRRKNRRNNV